MTDWKQYAVVPVYSPEDKKKLERYLSKKRNREIILDHTYVIRQKVMISAEDSTLSEKTCRTWVRSTSPEQSGFPASTRTVSKNSYAGPKKKILSEDLCVISFR